jgi:magnesium-transporting ATPase (P-type)
MPRLSLLDEPRSRRPRPTVTQDVMNVFSKSTKSLESPRGNRPAGDGHLAAVCRLQAAEACATLGSSLEGLSQTEADARLKKFGLNLVTRERKATILQELWGRARNPLNALLLTLATVSYFLGDVRAAIVIATMVILAITTAFIQEHRSNKAAAQLRAMVHTTASVRRGLSSTDNPFSEIPMEQLVPGDVVRLSAGDMIPGDLRLLEAKDLFINQSALTGEAMPAEKHANASDEAATLIRLTFRLGVGLVFALVWPGDARGRAAGVLCLVLAGGCVAAAWGSGEKTRGAGLNRWHEAAFLIGMGIGLISWFGQ